MEDEKVALRKKEIDHGKQLTLAHEGMYSAEAFVRMKGSVKKLMERWTKLEADRKVLTEAVALGESKLTNVKRKKTAAEKSVAATREEVATWKENDANFKVQFA